MQPLARLLETEVAFKTPIFGSIDATSAYMLFSPELWKRQHGSAQYEHKNQVLHRTTTTQINIHVGTIKGTLSCQIRTSQVRLILQKRLQVIREGVSWFHAIWISHDAFDLSPFTYQARGESGLGCTCD